MTELNEDLAIAKIVSLMTSYSFDTDRYSVEKIVQQWQKNYRVHWIYLATIEALYLGRYKAISIEQIMNGWYRRGQPNTHFNGDFERVICRKLPRHLSTIDYEERSYNGSRDARSPEQQLKENREVNTQFDRNGQHDPLVAPVKSDPPSNKVDCDDNESGGCFKKTRKSNHNVDRQPIIAPEVTGLVKRQITSPPQSGRATEKINHSQSHSENSEKIITFQPAPDASSFFQKLKALADNQRQKEG